MNHARLQIAYRVPMSQPHLHESAFDYQGLINCASGKLFGKGNPQLPMPPMLMFDRITHIDPRGGSAQLGLVKAELNIKPDMWFFKCHFIDDPVMPGCLGLDAMWQLIGFYLGWLGYLGKGRALGLDSLKFTNQVLPDNRMITYEIDFVRILKAKITVGVANGHLLVDGALAYTANNLKVGLIH